MTKEEFEHKKHIELLSNHLLENDWVWLYKKEFHSEATPSIYYKYWCYLVAPYNSVISLNSYLPDIEENVVSGIMSDYNYRSHIKVGYEHLTTIRNFKFEDKYYTQIRICDELIYYFDLYEEHGEDINYYYKIENNKKFLVCEIGNNYAKILNRFLIEFLAAKRMDLVCICQSEIEYNISDFAPSFQYNITDKTGVSIGKNPLQNYNLMINPCFSNMRNWFNGKLVYKHTSLKNLVESYYPDIPFIIGVTEEGLPKVADVNSHPYSKVFFDKALLSLYNSDVESIKIEPLSISSPNFYIRCDNDNDNCIIAFLKDLRDLPYNEQKKWYAFNCASDGQDFSDLFRQSIIHGNWGGIMKSKDFIFRDTYNTLQQKWENIYGWRLFKPLNSYQKDLINTLIILSSNNKKDFSDLLQHISLLFQDSFNMKQYPIVKTEEETRIEFFQRMLENSGYPDESLKNFLYYLQRLRSTISTAHHLSGKLDKETKDACNYFGLNYDLSNTAETSKVIFDKGIEAMNKIIKNLKLRSYSTASLSLIKPMVKGS